MCCSKCHREIKIYNKKHGLCAACYQFLRKRKLISIKNIPNNNSPNILSQEQESILIGTLLGDGHLALQKGAITASLRINRSIKDIKYLEYQFNIFKDFCMPYSSIKEYKRNVEVTLQTRACKVFNSFYDKWYVDKVKIIPKDLKLDPLLLAIWFCDDGSLTKTKNSRKLILLTEGFSLKENEFLVSLIKNTFDINFYVYKELNTAGD